MNSGSVSMSAISSSTTTISLATASTLPLGWRVLPSQAAFAYPMTPTGRFGARSRSAGMTLGRRPSRTSPSPCERGGFGLVVDAVQARPANRSTAPDCALALPDKPSIAVLPFQNMSGDPEQEYFADGMVEDIITALLAFQIAVRHRAQFELHLQGQSASISSRSAENSAYVTCSKVVCARRAARSASPGS